MPYISLIITTKPRHMIKKFQALVFIFKVILTFRGGYEDRGPNPDILVAACKAFGAVLLRVTFVLETPFMKADVYKIK